jgi:hypothetical protein
MSRKFSKRPLHTTSPSPDITAIVRIHGFSAGARGCAVQPGGVVSATFHVPSSNDQVVSRSHRLTFTSSLTVPESSSLTR